jgi:hypothetical protein
MVRKTHLTKTFQSLKGTFMLEINIPGAQTLRLSHLILDYNGTLIPEGRIVASKSPWTALSTLKFSGS